VGHHAKRSKKRSVEDKEVPNSSSDLNESESSLMNRGGALDDMECVVVDTESTHYPSGQANVRQPRLDLWVPALFVSLGLVSFLWLRSRKENLELSSSVQKLADELTPVEESSLDPSKKRFGDGRRDSIEEASWESFPASDPPSWTQKSN
jgi:hypothetical protein